jgi:hypothetical protein
VVPVTVSNQEINNGSWLDGKAEGTFTVTKLDGTREEQIWQNDQRVK